MGKEFSDSHQLQNEHTMNKPCQSPEHKDRWEKTKNKTKKTKKSLQSSHPCWHHLCLPDFQHHGFCSVKEERDPDLRRTAEGSSAGGDDKMLLATTTTHSLTRSRCDTERKRLQLLCHAAEKQNRYLKRVLVRSDTRPSGWSLRRYTHTHTHTFLPSLLLAEPPSWIYHRRRTLKDLVSMILLKKDLDCFGVFFVCWFFRGIKSAFRRTRPALSRMDKSSVLSLTLKVSWKPHRHKQGCSKAAGDYRLQIVRKWQEVLLS